MGRNEIEALQLSARPRFPRRFLYIASKFAFLFFCLLKVLCLKILVAKWSNKLRLHFVQVGCGANFFECGLRVDGGGSDALWTYLARSFDKTKCHPDHIDFHSWSDLGHNSLHETFSGQTLSAESLLAAAHNICGDFCGRQLDLLVFSLWVLDIILIKYKENVNLDNKSTLTLDSKDLLTDLFLHGCNSFFMLLDQMIVAFPTRIFHCIYPLGFLMWFLISSVLYQGWSGQPWVRTNRLKNFNSKNLVTDYTQFWIGTFQKCRCWPF